MFPVRRICGKYVEDIRSIEPTQDFVQWYDFLLGVTELPVLLPKSI
jgi:hypothetical protein